MSIMGKIYQIFGLIKLQAQGILILLLIWMLL